MRKFLVRTVLFVVVVAGMIGGVCIAEIVAEIKAYRREVVLPDASSVLLCNDSQFGNAVDPSVCPQFFNFSAHGRTLDQAYLTMKDVLDAKENAGRIKTVVFDVAPASLTWLAGRPAGDLDFSGKFYLAYLLHWREARELRDMDGWLKTARDNLVGRRLRLFWRTLRGNREFQSSLCGSFTPKSKALLMDAPESFAATVKLKLEQARGFEGVKEGDFAYRILDKVVEAARARSVELVFVSTPWHDDLVNACGKDEIAMFEKRLADYAAARGCRYVNLMHCKFPAEAWMDANHLNAVGARLFTPLLGEAVKR